MPELPDVTIYVERMTSRLVGQPLEQLRLASPFVLRSTAPPPQELEGRQVRAFRRMGKRIVWCFDDQLYLVVHLMIAGRLRWRDRGVSIPKRRGLAAFDFPLGSLLLTEEGTKKRASLHIVRGDEALATHDRGGADVFDLDARGFHRLLVSERHTLKRALTDPRLFSGIGNAYSDEILHRARLSPLQLTTNLNDDEIARLHSATQETLTDWIERIREEVGEGFPEKVTAFREGMAVHGRYGEPCPVCASPVQRIVYAKNEVNYCATCQSGGTVLADRALSRLLRKDWPRSIDEWAEVVEGGASAGP